MIDTAAAGEVSALNSLQKNVARWPHNGFPAMVSGRQRRLRKRPERAHQRRSPISTYADATYGLIHGDRSDHRVLGAGDRQGRRRRC